MEQASRYHIAQVNVAIPTAPLDSPALAGFVAALEPINRLADSSPGFIWRLQTEDGDATSIRAFDDDRIIVNMSVWESIEALRSYVYSTRHAAYLARRREWFERLAEAHLVLWWIPAGKSPTIADARNRLELLRRRGPTADAFTFRQVFDPPGSPRRPAAVRRPATEPRTRQSVETVDSAR